MISKATIPACGDCRGCGESIFSECSAKELDLISYHKGGNVYLRGQDIFYEGTRPNGVFCISSGKVKVYKSDNNGGQQIVRLARSGDLLGYRSLISGELYCSFAAPLEESLICFIPREIFFRLLESNGQLALKLLTLLSRDLKIAETRLAEMSRKPVQERLAETLLLLEDFYGLEKDQQTLKSSITREDLANIVGTATETLIRFLSEFRKIGLIHVDGRKIRILDHAALEKAARLVN